MREGFPTCEETVMSEKCSCTRISTTLFCCRSVTRDSYLKCGAVEAPGMYIVSAAKGAARGVVLQKSGSKPAVVAPHLGSLVSLFSPFLDSHGMSACQFSERLFTEMVFLRPWWDTIV